MFWGELGTVYTVHCYAVTYTLLTNMIKPINIRTKAEAYRALYVHEMRKTRVS